MSVSLVDSEYVDAYDRRREIAPDVRAAVVAAMGPEAPERDAVAVARPGSRLPAAGSVTLEDGSNLGRVDVLPADAPFGYHRLHRDDGVDQLLITGPGSCHRSPGLRTWGWAIQLAATRSGNSWGIGDLADLRQLGAWSADVGAGFVAVGPLGAPNPGPVPEPSPYYPSTRRFGSPLYLCVEEIPGAEVLGGELATVGRELNGERAINRAWVAERKMDALERIWAAATDRSAFEAWRSERGIAVERWATFVVLTERFGAGWRRWPEPFRDPASSAVRRFAVDAADRVAFHAWVQWCFDRQLAAASASLMRIADMPVGVDPGGFDAWDWQAQLAMGASIGAPPDRFNAAGQDWGLPPFIPHRLREAAYRPFIETIQAQLRHAGGLRIDHVLGLFRLWWIPSGHDPTRGAYVRSRTDELLEIVALESHRAGAIVIGEDLGTVPAGVRRELRRRRLLSTRLALFERVPPARYPAQSFAGVTTHDLPTVAGTWTGSDLEDQASSGVTPDPDALALLRSRLARAAGVGVDAPLGEVVVPLHERVAASPSALVAATLEDALGVEERPNLPGTVAPARQNWSLALPVALEELGEHDQVRAVVEALRR